MPYQIVRRGHATDWHDLGETDEYRQELGLELPKNAPAANSRQTV